LLVTDMLTEAQREELTLLTDRLAGNGTRFRFEVACDFDPGVRALSPADTEDAE
ncbi:MAG: hypothetical protein JWL77_4916, partial [Chthonomonadaceae bacterium]|nr:hypothetical protein [Chthonomonadaceae bacterium]